MSEEDSSGAGSAAPPLRPTEEAEVLDLRGLKCPLPALFARRRLQCAKPSETLVVLTDDPLAPIDIPHMCTQEAFTHVSTEKDGAVARIIVRR